MRSQGFADEIGELINKIEGLKAEIEGLKAEIEALKEIEAKEGEGMVEGAAEEIGDQIVALEEGAGMEQENAPPVLPPPQAAQKRFTDLMCTKIDNINITRQSLSLNNKARLKASLKALLNDCNKKDSLTNENVGKGMWVSIGKLEEIVGTSRAFKQEVATIKAEIAGHSAKGFHDPYSNKRQKRGKRGREEMEVSGGSSWLNTFESSLPPDFVVKFNTATSCTIVTGPGVSLAVRPLKRGVYQFPAGLEVANVMELVWADSRKALKVARHLAKGVDMSHVLNLAPSPPPALRKYMSSVDARHHVGHEWVDKKVLMLGC